MCNKYRCIAWFKSFNSNVYSYMERRFKDHKLSFDMSSSENDWWNQAKIIRVGRKGKIYGKSSNNDVQSKLVSSLQDNAHELKLNLSNLEVELMYSLIISSKLYYTRITHHCLTSDVLLLLYSLACKYSIRNQCSLYPLRFLKCYFYLIILFLDEII